MTAVRRTSWIFALLFFACGPHPDVEIRLLPCDKVYSIVPLRDSLYFSTLNRGIFRMHPDNPALAERVAGFHAAPFRSFIVTPDRAILAASYEQGLFRVRGDTMLPVAGLPRVIWRIRQDVVDGRFWFATERGVFVSDTSGYQQFSPIPDAHDIAFISGQIAVAHLNGISILDRNSGTVLRDYCTGQSSWVVETIGTRIIGGGGPLCCSIDPQNGRIDTIELKHNYLWSVTSYGAGNLLLGTQRGVFLVTKGSKRARIAGLPGICVKSVVVDSAGRVWAGKFWTEKP